MSDSSNPPLFPTIGEIASQADAVKDVDENTTQGVEGDDEERVIQEIDSLCMKCHEQVSGYHPFPELCN